MLGAKDERRSLGEDPQTIDASTMSIGLAFSGSRLCTAHECSQSVVPEPAVESPATCEPLLCGVIGVTGHFCENGPFLRHGVVQRTSPLTHIKHVPDSVRAQEEGGGEPGRRR